MPTPEKPPVHVEGGGRGGGGGRVEGGGRVDWVFGQPPEVGVIDHRDLESGMTTRLDEVRKSIQELPGGGPGDHFTAEFEKAAESLRQYEKILSQFAQESPGSKTRFKERSLRAKEAGASVTTEVSNLQKSITLSGDRGPRTATQMRDLRAIAARVEADLHLINTKVYGPEILYFENWPYEDRRNRRVEGTISQETRQQIGAEVRKYPDNLAHLWKKTVQTTGSDAYRQFLRKQVGGNVGKFEAVLEGWEVALKFKNKNKIYQLTDQLRKEIEGSSRDLSLNDVAMNREYLEATLSAISLEVARKLSAL
jgi:hypothetical protein